MKQKNFLVTGPPRCGKSTLIEAIVARIHMPMTGFFTREIIEKTSRVGFRIVTLAGEEGILAHEQIRSRFRVGKYGVNLDDLERIAVPSIVPSHPDEIVVIDEIGKMECYSPPFRQTLARTLNSPNKVLGSVALKGGPFIEQIKSRPDVRLVVVTEQNRHQLAGLLSEVLSGRAD
jgi:nucleoside-triphosphatase